MKQIFALSGRVNPHNYSSLDSQGGGGDYAHVRCQFDKYSSCLSWQVLNKNIGRMADETCSIL